MTKLLYDDWYVYELVDPRTNEVFYIGKTATPKRRLSDHWRNPESAAYARLREISEAGEIGLMRVIAKFPTEYEALDYEGYLIRKTAGLLNRTYGDWNPRPDKTSLRPVLDVEELVYEPDPDYVEAEDAL